MVAENLIILVHVGSPTNLAWQSPTKFSDKLPLGIPPIQIRLWPERLSDSTVVGTAGKELCENNVSGMESSILEHQADQCLQPRYPLEARH